MAKDTKIVWIESDIEKIQNKPNLYIYETGPDACLHLFKEGWSNCSDELNDKDSNGSKMTVSFDKATGKVTLTDNGRGFPENGCPLDIVCTKIQSGSKFYREQGGATNGELA